LPGVVAVRLAASFRRLAGCVGDVEKKHYARRGMTAAAF
jgi:hypothetical protein